LAQCFSAAGGKVAGYFELPVSRRQISDFATTGRLAGAAGQGAWAGPLETTPKGM